MTVTLHLGDCVEIMRGMEAGTIQTCVTSPPYYGLRDYGHDGQIGLEQTPEAYISKLVDVFREVRRVLKNDGTLWLNLGDSYASPIKGSGGSNPDTSPLQSGKGKENFQSFAPRKSNMGDAKPKDLLMIPARVALALQADGWYLRSEIIWHKPNPMPESVKDRPTKSHEIIYLLAKSKKYYYDAEAVSEPCVTMENRPNGVVRDREYGYDSKQSKLRKARKTDSWEKRKLAGAGRGSLENGHNSSIAKGEGFSHTLGNGLTRNKRDVWTVTTKPYKGAHFATFPPDLIEPCILAGSRIGDTVLDPFNGSGTTGVVSLKHGRNYEGIDLNPEYLRLTRERLEL